MALKIRLSRGGAKKRPFYRIVLADSRSPRDGKFLERLGTYNPMLAQGTENRVTLNLERIKHWLSVGAQPSDRVARFLADAGCMSAKTRPEQTKKPLPKAKAQARLKELAAAAEANAPAETAAE